MSINDDLSDASTRRQLVLLRYEAGLQRQVGSILAGVRRDIIAALPSVTSQTRRLRLERQLRDIQSVINDGYVSAQELMSLEMAEFAPTEAEWQIRTVNRLADFELMAAMPTEQQLLTLSSATLIQGAPAAEWWRSQSEQVQRQFAAAMRMGMAQNESLGQLVARVRAVMDVSVRNAYALTKTQAQAVSMAARMSSLQANKGVIKGRVSVATLDSRTSQVCAAYDNAAYDLENRPIPPNKLPFLDIPRHFNCRSSWSPLVKSFRELGLDINDFKPSTRASFDGQVPAGVSFSDFLAGKSKDWQDEWLGPNRAELWRDGKITLQDLVNGQGRELTLPQLRAMIDD